MFLLWLVADQTKLSTTAKSSITRYSGSIFVSAITAFEIAIKCRRGKLVLPLPTADWYADALDFHGIREMPITGSIAVASALLPPLHNDPCDRMIIATAEKNAMRIVTPDTLISQYQEADVVW